MNTMVLLNYEEKIQTQIFTWLLEQQKNPNPYVYKHFIYKNALL